MRYFSSIVLFLAALFANSSSFAQKGCDPRLWDHVYDKEWLRLKEYCITVKGTIYTTTYQDDGSAHIRLLLDKGLDSLLNNKNISDEYGCLVVTPICVGQVTYPNAIDACAGMANTVKIPKNGTRVKVSGIYVFNEKTGCNEIRPVTSITTIP